MDTLRDRQLAWLRHIEKTTGKKRTEIARAAGFDPSTLSKFVHNAEGHTLTPKIIQRIEDTFRIPAYENNTIPFQQSFSEEEARPYLLDRDTANPLELALKDIVSRSNAIDLWVLKTQALTSLGYMPGMVVVVDREAKPRNGDAVVAQKYDFRRGTAETIFRLWRTPYLMSASLVGEPLLPEIVDNEKLVIMGVITGACHIRH